MKNFLIKYVFNIFALLSMGFFFWYVKPESTINVEVFFWTFFPVVLLSILLVQFILLKTEKNIKISPHLKTVVQDKYIFEPSPLFSANSYVSIYYASDYEELMGIGYVEVVISKSKMLQVVIIDLVGDLTHEEIIKRKDKIILKPSLPVDSLNIKGLLKGQESDG